jgi:RNA polymerases M/15 Kd subunit
VSPFIKELIRKETTIVHGSVARPTAATALPRLFSGALSTRPLCSTGCISQHGLSRSPLPTRPPLIPGIFFPIIWFHGLLRISAHMNFRARPLVQASLQFCSECNNLLYPKADQTRRIMVYACRICAYDEINDNKCVYRNDLLTVTK